MFQLSPDYQQTAQSQYATASLNIATNLFEVKLIHPHNDR